MYTRDKRGIEPDDIGAVLTTNEVIELPDGRQGLMVCLVISDAVGKHFDAGEFPHYLHLANGVRDWRLEILPLAVVAANTPASPPAPEDSAPAVADAAAVSLSETIPPLGGASAASLDPVTPVPASPAGNTAAAGVDAAVASETGSPVSAADAASSAASSSPDKSGKK